MFVRVLESFYDDTGKLRTVNETYDVMPAVARRWLSDGKVSLSPAGTRDEASNDPYAVVPAIKFGVKFEPDFAVATNQTDKIQAWLNALQPGQYGVLPSHGWALLAADLLVPTGVTLEGSGRLYYNGANSTIPRLKFAPAAAPGGFNARLVRMKLKRIGLDISEPGGTGTAYLANFIFDGVTLDGTYSNYTSATDNYGVIIGERAYETNFINGCNINNWVRWGVDIRANSARDGSGSAYLATGVRAFFDGTTKFVNCGGNQTSGDGYGGYGGAVRVIGSPLDTGSLSFGSGALFDTCVTAIWADNENQQNPALACEGGGMRIKLDGPRFERCGRLLTDTNPYPSAQPVVFSRRNTLIIDQIDGLAIGTQPAGHRFIDLRGTNGRAVGVVSSVPSDCYIVYNDPTHPAARNFTVDIDKSGGLMMNVLTPQLVRESNTYETATLTFLVKKSGAAGAGTVTVALQNTNGESFGVGALSTATSGALAKSGSVSVGTGKNQVTYALNAAGNTLTVTLGDRAIEKAWGAKTRRNQTGASLNGDTLVSGGVVNIILTNNTAGVGDLIGLADLAETEIEVLISAIVR